jgi:hypothetical protein
MDLINMNVGYETASIFQRDMNALGTSFFFT